MKKYTFFFAFFLLFACEKINEDIAAPTIPTNPTPSDDTSGRIFYTWQGEDVVIDVFALKREKSVKNVALSVKPSYGTAAFSANGLLTYSPNDGIIAAEDQLIITVTTNDNVEKKEFLYFDVKAQGSEIPCHIGALPDRFNISNTIATTSVFDVLKNDQFCDATFDANSLKILLPPLSGKATIKAEKIEYIPFDSFKKGVDKLIYEVSATDKNGEKIKRQAVVIFQVEEKPITGGNCKNNLKDDIIILKSNFLTDSLIIKPLDNDKLCQNGSVGTLSISKNPMKGMAKVLSGNRISYKLNAATIGIFDIIEYKYCQNGDCETAKIIVNFSDKVKDTLNCKSKLQNDNIKVSLSKPNQDLSKGFLLIDVLNNDFICGILKDFTVTNISSKEVKIEVEKNGLIRFFPKNGKFEKGIISFDYGITDDKKEKSSAKAMLIFED